MSTAISSARPSERIALSRLLWVGPLAIVAAVVANILVRQVAVALLNPSPAFLPLSFSPPVTFTVIGMIGAIIVFALMARYAQRPVQLFQRVALIVLVVSFVPDILLLFGGPESGVTVANVIVLMLMHVVAWAIAVWMLTRLTQAPA